MERNVASIMYGSVVLSLGMFLVIAIPPAQVRVREKPKVEGNNFEPEMWKVRKLDFRR